MKLKLRNEFLAIDILTALLVLVIILFPIQYLRIALGLPFLFFFPGYNLIYIIFPRRGDLDAVERISLSIVLSIAVSPIITFVLNYTTWGIGLYQILVSISGVILVASAFAWQRRRRLPAAECPEFRLNFSLGWWTAQSPLNRALSIILILAILGSTGIMGYVIAKPKAGEKFTEFYILSVNEENGSDSYRLKQGEEGKAIIGIVNREHGEMGYWVETRINGEKIDEIGPIPLLHDKQWEQIFDFVLQEAGEGQTVEFILHKARRLGRDRDIVYDDKIEASNEVVLEVDVEEAEALSELDD
ncbi:DUF1616 domain-containing protein [Chloroflexota bacterium]